MKNMVLYIIHFFQHLKPITLKLWAFFKTNDVVKLLFFSTLTIYGTPTVKSNVMDDYLILVESITSGLSISLSFFMVVLLLISFYYFTFNLKSTVYNIKKSYYIYFLNISLFKILMIFFSQDNFMAIVIFELFYIFFITQLIWDLRKVILQQRENLHNSIFYVIQEKTGLIVIASSPSGVYGKRHGIVNHYMIGFNKNIKTWLLLGIFTKMDKDGIYLKNVFITYNEIVMFNTTFDKKIIEYSKNELDTVIMYSI